VLNFMANRLYRTKYTDLCYGYNAFWVRCVKTFELPPVDGTGPALGDGFEIETLITLRVAGARLAVAEVPSYEHDRLHGESNLNAMRDGWRVLRTILRERRASSRGAARRRFAAAVDHAVQAVEGVELPAQHALPAQHSAIDVQASAGAGGN
jgi:hypothetical protein